MNKKADNNSIDQKKDSKTVGLNNSKLRKSTNLKSMSTKDSQEEKVELNSNKDVGSKVDSKLRDAETTKAKSLSKSKKEKRPKSKGFKIGVSFAVVSVLALSLGLGLGLGLKTSDDSKASINVGPGGSTDISDLEDLDKETDESVLRQQELDKLLDQSVIFTFDQLAEMRLITNPEDKKEKAENSAQETIDGEKNGISNEEWIKSLNNKGFNNESEYKNSLVSDSLLSLIGEEYQYATTYVSKDQVVSSPEEANTFELELDKDSEYYLSVKIMDPEVSGGQWSNYYYVPNNNNSNDIFKNDEEIIYSQRYCSLAIDPDVDSKQCLVPYLHDLYDSYIQEYKPIATSHILLDFTYGAASSSEGESTEEGGTEDSSSSTDKPITAKSASMTKEQIERMYNFLNLAVDPAKKGTDSFNFERAAKSYGSDGSSSSGGSLGLVSALSMGFETDFQSGVLAAMTDVNSNSWIGGTDITKGGTVFNADWMWDKIELKGLEVTNNNFATGKDEFDDNVSEYLELFGDSYTELSNLIASELPGVVQLGYDKTNPGNSKYRDILYKLDISSVEALIYDTSAYNSTNGNEFVEFPQKYSSFAYPVFITSNGIHIVKIDQLHPEEYYSGFDLSGKSNSLYPSNVGYYEKTDNNTIMYLTDGENIFTELGYRQLVYDLNAKILGTGNSYGVDGDFNTWVSSNINYYITKKSLSYPEFQEQIAETSAKDTGKDNYTYMEDLLESFNNKYFNNFRSNYYTFAQNTYDFYNKWSDPYAYGTNITNSDLNNWVDSLYKYLVPNTKDWEVKNLLNKS